MARKLQTYVTQIGFFDLAVAAPSMKAALEAWGMTKNAFHQGFAEETDDPQVIAATMAMPGTVLRRAVGSTGEFKEHADLPKSLPANAPVRRPLKKIKSKKSKPVPKTKVSKQTEQAQVLSFEKARATRERERARQEAERQKQQAVEAREAEKRKKAADAAQAILDRARKRHEVKMERIEKSRLAVDQKADAEQKRWERERGKMEDNVRKAER